MEMITHVSTAMRASLCETVTPYGRAEQIFCAPPHLGDMADWFHGYADERRSWAACYRATMRLQRGYPSRNLMGLTSQREG